MDNYKIKVKDEAESKEAQELFFELGFHWKWSNKREFLRESIPYLFTQEKDIYYGVSLTEFYKCEGEELTLAELRVLATPKIKKDQGLISGAEAHKALLAGENVQYSGDGGEEHWDTALNCNIGVFLNQEKFPNFKFRVAPRTIKVNSELPKPHKETQHNALVFAVTYEFKSREERNAFADKLRGNNS